jgi:hypothetical protein
MKPILGVVAAALALALALPTAAQTAAPLPAQPNAATPQPLSNATPTPAEPPAPGPVQPATTATPPALSNTQATPETPAAAATPGVTALNYGPPRWTADRAAEWYAAQPWIVGANFLPSTAINELEMFQAETWDPITIERELALAQSIGMNTVRVYLHDQLWAQDRQGFTRRLDQFLAIADRHGIKTVLVLFDSCWDPDPRLGRQRDPIPGIHNSGWVQTPSRRDLIDPAQHPRLLAYVRGVVGQFARDRRVLMWDVWNEPDNSGGGSYNPLELPGEKAAVELLLPQVFAAARQAGATQPLTSPLWIGDDWSPTSLSLTAIQRIQVAQSDVISIHDYNWPEIFERRVAQARAYGRPVIVTEWLARSNGSTVETILPLGRQLNVGMISWGLVDGRSQTRFPWDSWDRPYVTNQPSVWFHDLFRADGTPYREREAELFRSLTGRVRVAAGR